MRFGRIGAIVAAIGLALVATAQGAEARGRHPSASAVHGNVRAIQAGIGLARHSYAQHSYAQHSFGRHSYAGRSFGRYSYGGGRLQCVPFARENTGIELAGNAGTWWNAAEGVYERGARPEVGSVLNFRATGRMRMGHVAVVSGVVDARNIRIDHANWWGPGSVGGVNRDVTVVDVSERNDWSAVRVSLGHTGDFGSIYPTYGFIYDRPDHGTMVANNLVGGRVTPAPALNAPPHDLRPAEQDVEEVAEAEDDRAPRSRHAFHGRHHTRAGFAHAGLYRVSRGGSSVHGGHDSHRHRRHA